MYGSMDICRPIYVHVYICMLIYVCLYFICLNLHVCMCSVAKFACFHLNLSSLGN